FSERNFSSNRGGPMMKALSIDDRPDAPATAGAPLRVALFSGNYNYVMDGPVRALNRLVAHLEMRGHQALVFAPTTRTPAFKHSGELVSIPSIALPGSRSEYRLGLGISASARRRLDRFAPTIIHVAAPDWLGYSALNYARKNGVPAVASFHTRFDTYPRYYGMAWLESHITNYMRRFYGRCERIYAPSPSMVEELKRDRIGRDIGLWARGVDQSLFNPARRDLAWRRGLGVQDGDILVAFVGRVVLEKGIDIFADAVKRAAAVNPNIRALVVGDGPERRNFESLLPTGAFTGYLQGEDLARAYASADIFFNPSVTETFGNVTLEAMASGLPSICAAASGSKSLVDHGETGLLVADARNAENFAAAIVELAGDPERRVGMGAAARSSASVFDWDAILDGLIGEYQEIATAGKARPAALS
ncbi:MAG: glycosyltransferase family 1 protein, partial [Parvularculaceae bacterium]